MSRVMNELFLGSKTEEEIELSNDPEYIEWTEKLDEQFRKEFEFVEQRREDRPKAH